jgi:hypothetical protein
MRPPRPERLGGKRKSPSLVCLVRFGKTRPEHSAQFTHPPGGGLQIYDEQFPFLAPEKDYIAADEIDMTVKPDVPWTQDVKRSYFVRTGDGKYATVKWPCNLLTPIPQPLNLDCFNRSEMQAYIKGSVP